MLNGLRTLRSYIRYHDPITMTLCSRCEKFNLTEVFTRSIPPNSSTVAPQWIHSDSFALLRSSAESCALCAIVIGDSGTIEKIEDDDSIKLRTFTRDQWPRSDAPWQCPLPVAGLEVSIGPKDGSAVHSVRHVPLWAADGKLNDSCRSLWASS